MPLCSKDIDKKTDKVSYTYYYINPDGKLTSRPIDLPADEYENEQIRKGMGVDIFGDTWRIVVIT